MTPKCEKLEDDSEDDSGLLQKSFFLNLNPKNFPHASLRQPKGRLPFFLFYDCFPKKIKTNSPFWQLERARCPPGRGRRPGIARRNINRDSGGGGRREVAAEAGNDPK